MKKVRAVQTILLMLLISVSVFVTNVAATPEDGVAIGDFHMGFFLGHNPDGTSSYSFDFVVMIHNLNDIELNGRIPGVYEPGNLLVDVVVTDGSGNTYSVNDPTRKLQMSWEDPNNDHLTFRYSVGGSEETVLPVGIYTAKIVSLSGGVVLDTASFNTYYKDASGAYSLPPPKQPIQIYPAAGSTIMDATPTFTWQYPTYQYEGDFFGYRVSTYWINYGGLYEWGSFLWNLEPKPTSMSFPDAPEVPSSSLYTIAPPGETIPAELPSGTLAWDVSALEYFLSGKIGGDPRCYFTVNYGKGSYYNVAPKWTVSITPEALNLASNGKWITGRIELPEGYNVNDIDVSSIRLNGVVPIDTSFVPKVGDSDSNGVSDLTVKFDRAAVAYLLRNAADVSQDTGKFSEAELQISGNVAGTPFNGVCTIKVIRK